MTAYSIIPSFLNGPNGRLFSLLYDPTEGFDSLPVIIHVPPFAEEMNKSRPMVASQARKLAELGYPVVVFDLFGTGDSEGDFDQATWDKWKDDLAFVGEWVNRQMPKRRIVLWGLRSGCLLSVNHLVANPGGVASLVFWQPVLSGKRVIKQLKRLDQLSSKSDKEVFVMEPERMAGTVEIAGYQISAELIETLSRAEFIASQGLFGSTMLWLEVNPPGMDLPAFASQQVIETLRDQSDAFVQVSIIQGEPFWLTPEVAMVSEVVEKTALFIDHHFGR